MCRQTQTHNTHKPLDILQWNVRGIPENWFELKHHLLSFQKTIICIQETHLKQTDPYNFQLFNYSMIRKDTPLAPEDRRRGGVCTYIQTHIPFRSIQTNTNFDIQAIEIKTLQSFITIINFYAPPTVTLTEFLDDLETIMNSITTPIILCGDINAHHPMWETSRTIPDHK